MNLNEMKKELKAKKDTLAQKREETRNSVNDGTAVPDEVRAQMDDIASLQTEIKKLEADIELCVKACQDCVSAMAVSNPSETNSSDEEDIIEDVPDETNASKIEKNEKRSEDIVDEKDMETRMKLKVGGEIADKKVTAFADYLKTGEVRDVTGLALNDGKVIIPETILNPTKEVYQFPRLGALVRTVSVTTTTGKLPIIWNSTDSLNPHTEYNPTASNAAPVIQPILWDLQTYTGEYVFSQELISDSSYDWQADLQSRLTELRDNTEDKYIMQALTTGITSKKSTDLLADIKTALNVTLKPQDSAQAAIVMSQAAYNAFDQATDAVGRPLLQPNITTATGNTLLGKTVVIVPDTLFPSAKAGDVNIAIAPLQKAVINFKLAEITGQFQDSYDVWYKRLGIFLRENIVQARPDLIINLTGTVKQVVVVPTQAG